MGILQSYFPEPAESLELDPAILSGFLLEYLSTKDDSSINRHNFYEEAKSEFGRTSGVPEALLEAWAWLEREGFIIDKGDQHWCFLSRRARRTTTRDDLQAFRRANILPREFLHPMIVKKVWNSFLQGEYDTAVFQAFKEVEVAVREAGGYEPTDLGVILMRKAFNSDSGPLTSKNDPAAEREAISALFAGAIGSYKNPASHRHISIDAHQAVEMIILASHLLGIVDARQQEATGQTSETNK